MTKLIFGVGINDADYNVTQIINGKTIFCPYYDKWREMIRRCYHSTFHEKHPTYIGCTVCEEWLTFSNFKSWMETQDWEDKELDKDLLSNSNVYSPETCVFISPDINCFLTMATAIRGEYPIGVSLTNNGKKYRTRINGKHIGTFETILEAHQAWQRGKLAQAIEHQTSINDVRVKDGLQRIINLLTEDLSNNNITTSF